MMVLAVRFGHDSLIESNADALKEAYMKILGMGVPELLIILAVILLIFGPKNLPKLGSALGKTVKNLREGVSGGKENVDEIIEDDHEGEGKPVAAIEEAAEEEAAPKKKKVTRRVTTSA